MPYNTKKIITDVTGRNPVPAYFNPDTDQYEPLFGQNGSNRVLIWGANDQPLLTQDNPGHVQLTGSIVEDVNGTEAVRTKQTALAYESWFFDGNSDEVTVTAGSQLEETEFHHVNGYSVLTAIGRSVGQSHDWRLRLRWATMSGGNIPSHSIGKDFGEAQASQDVEGTQSTIAEWVRGILYNDDTVDHTYHVAFLLRV